MIISEEHLREFARIYKEEFGEEITIEEARAMATQLLELYRLLLRPPPGDPDRDQDCMPNA